MSERGDWSSLCESRSCKKGILGRDPTVYRTLCCRFVHGRLIASTAFHQRNEWHPTRKSATSDSVERNVLLEEGGLLPRLSLGLKLGNYGFLYRKINLRPWKDRQYQSTAPRDFATSLIQTIFSQANDTLSDLVVWSAKWIPSFFNAHGFFGTKTCSITFLFFSWY